MRSEEGGQIKHESNATKNREGKRDRQMRSAAKPLAPPHPPPSPPPNLSAIPSLTWSFFVLTMALYAASVT